MSIKVFPILPLVIIRWRVVVPTITMIIMGIIQVIRMIGLGVNKIFIIILIIILRIEILVVSIGLWSIIFIGIIFNVYWDSYPRVLKIIFI